MPLDVYEFVVSGNSVLEADTIVATLEPFVGPGRSTDDVDRARTALESAYKDRGYKTVAVTIPRQTGKGGVIRFEVVESKVRLLTVTGSKYHSIDAIVKDVPSLAEGTVPDFDEIQKDLVALNQDPDRKITPALKPGPRPGTLDVALTVDDHLPLHGSLEVNNRRSQNTSELRSTASFTYSNLWQRGHTINLTFQTAPQQPSDSKVWFGSYLVRFAGSPFSLMVDAIKSDSDVSTLGDTNIVGRGETYGARLFMALESEVDQYRSLTFGLDYKRYNTLTSIEDAGFSTPVAYWPILLGFNWGRQNDRGNRWDGNLNATWASTLSGKDLGRLDDNARHAGNGIFYLRGELSTVQSLWKGSEGYARLASQWAEATLVTNEQISAGGADSVRGYLESETLGDRAVVANLELRAPSLGDRMTLGTGSPVFDQFQPFLFADAASLHVISPGNEQKDAFDIASAGVGINFRMLAALDGMLDLATALRDGPATDKGSSRVLFRLQGKF